MVCSCAMSFNCFWLQILFCSCVNETTLFSFLWSLLRENDADRFASRRYSLKNKLGDRMIKQLLNSVVAKYRDLSVSRRSIICWSRRLRQIIDLLATDKSRYFAQPRPITANYSHFIYNQTGSHACVPVDNRVWFALSLYGVFLVPLSTSVTYLRRTTWP